jgi:adenosylhomocysteine nucleosidase
MNPMALPAVWILTAVAMETHAVARELGIACPQPGEPMVYQMSGGAIVLHGIGIRARGLSDGAVDRWGIPNLVILAGLGGALSPTLAIGDVVIEGLDNTMALPSGSQRGSIVSADQVVATPSEKTRLFETTGALAVDMEAKHARPWAGRFAAPFVHIRAISDRAEQSLDPALLYMVDPWGRVKPKAVAATLLAKPWLVPQMIRLGKDSNLAAKSMATAAVQVAHQWVDRTN